MGRDAGAAKPVPLMVDLYKARLPLLEHPLLFYQQDLHGVVNNAGERLME